MTLSPPDEIDIAVLQHAQLQSTSIPMSLRDFHVRRSPVVEITTMGTLGDTWIQVYFIQPDYEASRMREITGGGIKRNGFVEALEKAVRTPMDRVYESGGLKRWTVPTRPKDDDSRLR